MGATSSRLINRPVNKSRATMERSKMKIRSDAAAPITKLIFNKRLSQKEDLKKFELNEITCKCDRVLDSKCK
jgi:hypothetical protein